jgi:hypothetical protein
MSTAPALAQEESPAANTTSCTADRYLVLTPEVALPEPLSREIRTDLAAELAPRGISVCDQENPNTAPLALVTLRASNNVVAIELDDRTTHKRVARDLRLEPIPESGRALATAIAIDELLRASWAELTLRPPRAPTPETEEPPPRAKPEAEPRPAPRQPPADARLTQALHLSTGFAHGAESWNAFSLSLRADWWPRTWAWFEVGASVLRAFTVEVPVGEVAAQGVGADLTAGACLPRTGRLFGCAGARAGVDWIAFDARADASEARARRDVGSALRLEGVGMAGLSLPHHMFLLTQLSLGAPVQSVVATDGTEPVLGLRGLMWSGALGLGVQR